MGADADHIKFPKEGRGGSSGKGEKTTIRVSFLIVFGIPTLAFLAVASYFVKVVVL